MKAMTYIGLPLGVLALSTSAIFVRLADAPPSIAALYRLLFAALVLAPVVLLSKNRRRELVEMPRKQVVLSILSGALLAVHYILWFESLALTSVASSTVIVTLQPIFSMLLGYFFLRERQTKTALLGCAVALGGSFVIGYGDFQGGGQALLGDVLALVAAAVISGYFFVGQHIRKSTSAEVYSLLGYSGSVLFLAAYALVKGDAFFPYSAFTWQCFLGLALVSTIMGQFVFNVLLKRLSATTISVGILGEPVGTCILAYFILGEGIGYQQGIGIAVILGGLALYFLSVARVERRATTSEGVRP